MSVSAEHYQQILASGHQEVYMALVVIASLVGGYLIRQDAQSWPLNTKLMAGVLLFALTGALVGCAIPAYFAGGVVEARAWSAYVAPKTVVGGLLFSFIAVALFNRLSAHGVDTSDGFARGAIAMMAIGRLGCVFQHCCFGVEASWGLDFGDGVTRLPVQWFEVAGLLSIWWFIQYCHRRNLFAGQRLFLVFALYGSLRFGLEFLREPIAQIYFGIGYYQWLALILASIGVWHVVRRRQRRLVIGEAA